MIEVLTTHGVDCVASSQQWQCQHHAGLALELRWPYRFSHGCL